MTDSPVRKSRVKRAAPPVVASTSKHPPRALPPRTKSQQAAIDKAYSTVRKLCAAVPGCYEKAAWAAPTFRIEKGKMFLMFADNHHDDGRAAIWCMSTPDAREAWLAMAPERFFIPPYVGASGWIGATLEGDVPWDVLEEVILEAARLGRPVAGRARGRR
ncbi:MAG: MmcQ/YjbR family DNA-binding protein [Polyangiaceae bacterium]